MENLSVFGDDGGANQSVAMNDHIILDAMGLGMGCCCLQVTFQAQSVDEARFLYDQLTPLTPILLAMSAAAPIWRGYLTDVDCRWNVLCALTDDRTAEERGFEVIDIERKKTNYADGILAIKKSTISSCKISLLKCGLLHISGKCHVQRY